MKTSTFLVSVAVIGAFATVTATNLKLKSEYTKGNIKSDFVNTAFAPFRFIQTQFDSTIAFMPNFNISVDVNNESTIGGVYGDDSKLIFKVVNDTLYISNDPHNDGSSRHIATFDIKTKSLNGITTTRGLFKVSQKGDETLYVNAFGESRVNLLLDKISVLKIIGDKRAEFSLSAKEAIGSAFIKLSNKSSLDAINVIINQKTVQIDSTSSLKLSGRSLENFGVKN